jgi:1,5-anhydro-D-fructose reductase (1,5-anhydro-D-mannitol-forming)
MKRWGIWGASTIAKEWIIDAIRSSGGQVVSICSTDAQRGGDYAKHNGILRSTTDARDFLGSDIDFVYIGTVNDRHRDQVTAAAQAGKHVLCEKPVALTLTDVDAMIAACAEANVQFAVNHHLRTSAAHRTMRDLIGSGRIGRPLAARVCNAGYLPSHLQSWRVNDLSAGAGVVLDLTVHDADLLRFILNDEPISVMARAQQGGMAENGIEDGVMTVISFRSGAIAQTHEAFMTPFAEQRVEVHGTKGTLVASNTLSQRPGGSLSLRTEGGVESIALEHHNLYATGVKALMDAAVGNGVPAASALDGRKSLAFALSVLKSAKEGRLEAVE